jgi:hypothetical protein
MLLKNKSKKIELAIVNVLLNNSNMDLNLYKQDLEENISDIKQGLIDDDEHFAIAITEKKGNVAMCLVTLNNELYINEQAHEKLKSMWIKTYKDNINFMIPHMVSVLKTNHYWINGVKIV